MSLLTKKIIHSPRLSIQVARCIHLTAPMEKTQSGKYKVTKRRDFPLTYEMANPPFHIAHRKAWNSWNTSNLEGGLRPSETAVEDEFIRKFVMGTWQGLFLTEIIIKRQHNIIRIAGIIQRAIGARKMYFLIGYTEELLSFWLQCPVKLELQTVADKKDVIFKYI
ncbi:small ribosomal subunit protein uS3m [Cylas formicarius]|uniref:small ribosomal subunit protein uS3m n=1 Tax=Cylas formicarius TaxID=197179 RepID=UPI0029585AF8|nr:small ribosomal subunit protein uS3m [Cylas formicarius]